jgi:hypothetical protein
MSLCKSYRIPTVDAIAINIRNLQRGFSTGNCGKGETLMLTSYSGNDHRETVIRDIPKSKIGRRPKHWPGGRAMIAVAAKEGDAGINIKIPYQMTYDGVRSGLYHAGRKAHLIVTITQLGGQLINIKAVPPKTSVRSSL